MRVLLLPRLDCRLPLLYVVVVVVVVVVGGGGAQGAQGVEGSFGGATFEYKFKTGTSDADPGAGKLGFNNGTLSSAGVLYIDDVDGGGTDIQAFIRTIDDSMSTIKGHVRVSNRLNADDFALFTIRGTNTEATGYHKVNVAFVSGATSFSNNEDIIITLHQDYNWDLRTRPD